MAPHTYTLATAEETTHEQSFFCFERRTRSNFFFYCWGSKNWKKRDDGGAQLEARSRVSWLVNFPESRRERRDGGKEVKKGEDTSATAAKQPAGGLLRRPKKKQWRPGWFSSLSLSMKHFLHSREETLTKRRIHRLQSSHIKKWLPLRLIGLFSQTAQKSD